MTRRDLNISQEIKACKATLQEQVDRAKEHYETISMGACDWMSIIPKALDFYAKHYGETMNFREKRCPGGGFCCCPHQDCYRCRWVLWGSAQPKPRPSEKSRIMVMLRHKVKGIQCYLRYPRNFAWACRTPIRSFGWFLTVWRSKIYE